MFEAILFDFDGVIADSEVLANCVLADMVTALGWPTSLDDALGRYMGKRLPDLMAAIESDLGKPVSGSFAQDLQAATLASFRSDLREVPGARAFLDAHAAMTRCIASSSSRERLALSLEVLGLTGHFAGGVFSADEVSRGKPHPDLFLMAADRLGADPAHCLVIEDSESGVRAGLAAGMTVVGFCAGGHVRPGHSERLVAAGAHHTANNWNDVALLLRQ
ncbi:MAG: HAD-IA family hydrolase [Alphaproteobacteria bacterium]|nr:HAD-IA family hydrolase [Alphaproteobacteria bacterium]